jgi:hypothetical protein
MGPGLETVKNLNESESRKKTVVFDSSLQKSDKI